MTKRHFSFWHYKLAISSGGDLIPIKNRISVSWLYYLDLGEICRSFFPSVFHAGESVYLSWLIHSILQIMGESLMQKHHTRRTSSSSFLLCPTLLSRPIVLPPLVLALFAFNISCGGKSYLSRFTHPISRLCYLDLGVLCSFYPPGLQYLMRGRVLPIKVSASYSSALLLGPWGAL